LAAKYKKILEAAAEKLNSIRNLTIGLVGWGTHSQNCWLCQCLEYHISYFKSL